MDPAVRASGAHGLRALISLFFHPHALKTPVAKNSMSGGTPEVMGVGNPGLAVRSDLRVERSGDLNASKESGKGRSASICKLSLTRDDVRHPRARKDPFGHDFEPFM